MKQLGRHLASALVLALFVAGFGTSQAVAQDDVAQRTEQLREAWESAVQNYQNRSFADAYQQFVRVAELGQSLEDPTAQETAQRALQYLPRVAYAEGLTHLQGERYNEAIQAFDKGLAQDDTYLNNMLGKGQAYNRMGRSDDALAIFVEALEKASAANDRDAIQRSSDAIRGYYQPRASELLASAGETGNRTQARQVIELLEEMQEHVDADANTYYYLGAANNVLGEYQRAVELLDQGIELHTGSRTDAARFHFEKGEALRLMGNVAQAKEAYQNAAYGSYRQPAEHFIETL